MSSLTPAVIHVLLALAAGERHGYAILKLSLIHISEPTRPY